MPVLFALLSLLSLVPVVQLSGASNVSKMTMRAAIAPTRAGYQAKTLWEQQERAAIVLLWNSLCIAGITQGVFAVGDLPQSLLQSVRICLFRSIFLSICFAQHTSGENSGLENSSSEVDVAQRDVINGYP